MRVTGAPPATAAHRGTSVLATTTSAAGEAQRHASRRIHHDRVDDTRPRLGRTTEGETLSTEEYGSLTVEDDPDGTVDGAELAGTADESDHDQPDSGTQPDEGSS